MTQEIERKFLVKGDFKSEAFKAIRITQGYLSSVPDRIVRVRVKGAEGYITIKGICYLIKFLFHLPHRVEIISDDDSYKIDTILNIENQRESLYGMAEKFYKLSPGEYEEWKSKLLEAIDKIQEESQRG